MITETITAPSKPALKRPPLYKVMLFDDDVSTFQCVIDIVANHFNKTADEGFDIAFKINARGAELVGIYPKDTAKTKIALANDELKVSGYPLRIELYKST